MDFKSLMSAQIAKSKPQNASTTSSKYQRRAEAEQERAAAYAAEQAKLEKERQERLEKKRKYNEEEEERNALREEKKRKLAEESKIRREAQEIEEDKLRRKRLGLPERPSFTTPQPEEQVDIPDDELRAKLEEMKQPVIQDEQETHEARLARYHKLISKATSKKRKILYPGPIPTTIEPLPADQIILPTTIPKPEDKEAYIHLHRQISSYLNFLLTEWASALAARSPEDATSQPGLQAQNNYKTVLTDLAPLMRRLEAAVHPTLPSSSTPAYEPLPHSSLLTPLVTILHLTQKRHYRSAVDAYLKLSIGKAAWPIGVTMVGIHERSAREKLHEDGKNKSEGAAHILSDEGTRKWLQSLKRCVSFAQGRWEVFDVGELMG